MQSDNRFFDDLAKVLNGAAGTLAGMGREAESGMKERMRGFMGGMDFVSREEFEAVKAMASKARAQADALAARVAVLEGKAPPQSAASPKPPATKPPAPKQTATKPTAPKMAASKPIAAKSSTAKPAASKPAQKGKPRG